ncbi:MAG: NUDIX hydrolase [Bacteroidales bacterium]|nr:NUDIX hydrolase [Bacteroidales bacterium]
MKRWCYDYPRPAVTVDAILLYKEKKNVFVALIKRKNEPYKNLWALPGGFVDENETLEHAIRREVKEELQIDLPEETFNQFRAYSDPKRDPRHRTITITFIAWLDDQIKLSAADDAAEASWFSLFSLPSMAFDHAKILEDVKKHLLLTNDITNDFLN